MKNDCFFFLDKRKATAGANIDHVDNRQLKQVSNESQTSNTTTTASTITSVSAKTLSTLPPSAVVNDKSKQLHKTAAETHDRELHAHGDHIQASPTWKKFIWTNDVSQCLLFVTDK